MLDSGRGAWQIVGAPLKVLLVLSTALAVSPAEASAPVTMNTTFIGTLEVDGDSTLHRFSARTHDLRAAVQVDAAPEAPGDLEGLLRAGRVRSVEVVVPVTGLRAGDGSLERNLWKALKSDRFPAIRFVAEWFEVRPPSATGASWDLAMRGRLAVAGVERPIVMGVNAFRRPGGIRVVGHKDILMTDHGIEPPTMMLGALKTADRVTVKLDVELRTP